MTTYLHKLDVSNFKRTPMYRWKWFPFFAVYDENELYEVTHMIANLIGRGQDISELCKQYNIVYMKEKIK